jgi:hypothetical protein
LTLREVQEIALLLPGQMPDVPAQAIHRQKAFAGFFILTPPRRNSCA